MTTTTSILSSMKFIRKQKTEPGTVTELTLLSGIIKDGWVETVYERDDFYAIHVERHEEETENNSNHLKQEFRYFIHELKDAFGVENIKNIDTVDAIGSYFIVYMKKNNSDSWNEEDQERLKATYAKYNIE